MSGKNSPFKQVGVPGVNIHGRRKSREIGAGNIIRQFIKMRLRENVIGIHAQIKRCAADIAERQFLDGHILLVCRKVKGNIFHRYIIINGTADIDVSFNV